MSLRAARGLLSGTEVFRDSFGDAEWFRPIKNSLAQAEMYFNHGSYSDCMNSLDEAKFRISNVVEAYERSKGYYDDGIES